MKSHLIFPYRLILIGDSTVGKSSLLKYFTDGRFAEVSESLNELRVINIQVADRSSFYCAKVF